MLENIDAQFGHRQVYRLHKLTDDRIRSQFLSDHTIDEDGRRELSVLLSEDLLDEIFQRKYKLRRGTRFSNGTFPIYYSSLEFETAKTEVKYWLPKFIGDARTRTVHYRQTSCQFDGQEIDLRSKTKRWPQLVGSDSSSYEFYTAIASEAIQRKLDGFLTFSARRKTGVNSPIFSRKAISKVKFGPKLAMTCDANIGEVTTQEIDETQ